MSSLFILLPPEPVTGSSEFAYVVTPDGRSAAAHASAAAALLPPVSGAGAEVVAIVPGAALSWHQVELPKGVAPGTPRARAVLEGLLEDHLLEEPDTLHFALQPQTRAGAPAWVAVCSRPWLRAALQQLEAAGRPVNRVVPEFAPGATGAAYVLGEPDDATLVASGPAGVLLLPLAAGSLALLPPLSDDTPLYAEPAVAAQAEQVLQRPVVIQQEAQRWLQAGQSGWDLAQFDFASSGRARTLKKLTTGWAALLRAPQWRPARWGAVAVVLANLVGLNAWAWKERSALEAKREAVRQTLTQTFPQVKVIVDAPVQMEREVAALRQATGTTSGRDLEALLTALAAVSAGRSVTSLEYNGAELRVKGLALNAEELRLAQPALKSQGLSAALQGDLLVLSPENAQ